MKRVFIVAIAAGILVSSCFADQIDDAEAKKRGITVEAVQLEHAKARILELQGQVAALQLKIAKAEAKPTTATSPATKAASPQPIGNISIVKVGSVGVIPGGADIVQVIDANNMLVKLRAYDMTVWITGVDTTNIADDMSLNFAKSKTQYVFKYVGTKSYTTALGAKRTVEMLELQD